MKVDTDVDERGHWYGQYETFYELKYCEPALRLLAVPAGTPELIWLNPSSAANRLRAAIDQLLTDLGVSKSGSTHKRIERLAAPRPEVATVLEAVKWIGNDGSHMAALPLKDVLEGVALLERALTVDSLNQDRLGPLLPIKISGEQSIGRLERWLIQEGYAHVNRDVGILRRLQRLRSKAAAHRKGSDYSNFVMADLASHFLVPLD